MKIDEYYKQSGTLSLNASIVALFPIMILMILSLFVFENEQLLILNLPFFIYSFSSYQLYLMRNKMALDSSAGSSNTIERQTWMNGTEFLVLQSEEEEDSILFFQPDGLQIATLRPKKVKWTAKMKRILYGQERHLQYVLVDHDERVLSTIIVKKSKGIMEIYNHNHDYLGSFVKVKERLFQIDKNAEVVSSTGQIIGLIKSSNLFLDDQFIRDGHRMARLRKGWLSLDMTQRFRDPNTPLLTFNENLRDSERIVCVSMLLKEYL